MAESNKLVHLRVPRQLYADSQEIINALGFSNIQEFARDALRRAVHEYKVQAAIRRLEKLKGSVKGIKRLTDEERRQVYLKFIADPNRSDIFRKYGLK